MQLREVLPCQDPCLGCHLPYSPHRTYVTTRWESLWLLPFQRSWIDRSSFRLGDLRIPKSRSSRVKASALSVRLRRSWNGSKPRRSVGGT